MAIKYYLAKHYCKTTAVIPRVRKMRKDYNEKTTICNCIIFPLFFLCSCYLRKVNSLTFRGNKPNFRFTYLTADSPSILESKKVNTIEYFLNVNVRAANWSILSIFPIIATQGSDLVMFTRKRDRRITWNNVSQK